MDESAAPNRAGRAAAVVGVIAVLVALAALLDIWPFDDGELSVEEFLAQGDELCQEAHDEILDLQSSTPRTPSDAAELTRGVIEVAEEERDAISDLGAPDSLSEQVDGYLDTRARGIDVLREGVEAAQDRDADEYEALQARVARTQLERYGIAKRIGFEVCSKPLVGREELARQAEEPSPSDPSAPPTVNNPPTGTP